MKTKMLTVLTLAVTFVLVASAAFAIPAQRRDLYIAATDGYMYLGDGTKMYIRGFVSDNVTQNAAIDGKGIIPGPIIEVSVNDDVFIHMRTRPNAASGFIAPPDPHNIHLHGIHPTSQNDGFPENSWAIPIGSNGVYYMNPEVPGSTMYHCHVEASEHVHLGLYGAMIIRPEAWNPTSNKIAYDGLHNDSYDYEYIQLVGEADTTWHKSVEKNLRGFNAVNFKPSYWLLNGRTLPDTLGAPGAGLLACGPSGVPGPAATIECGPSGVGAGPPVGYLTGAINAITYDAVIDVPNFIADPGALPPGYNAPRVLIRYIPIAYQHVAMHLHGWHVYQIGKDMHPIPVANQQLIMTVGLTSGSTDDLLLVATPKSALPTPTYPSQYAAYAANSFFGSGENAGVLYLGIDPFTPQSNNINSEVYVIHSHYDYTVVNNGVYPGGAATFIYAHPGPKFNHAFPPFPP